jgi:hypothetical protein
MLVTTYSTLGKELMLYRLPLVDTLSM